MDTDDELIFDYDPTFEIDEGEFIYECYLNIKSNLVPDSIFKMDEYDPKIKTESISDSTFKTIKPELTPRPTLFKTIKPELTPHPTLFETDEVELIFERDPNIKTEYDPNIKQEHFNYRPIIKGKIGNHTIDHIYIYGGSIKPSKLFKILIIDTCGLIINSGPVYLAKEFTLHELLQYNYVNYIRLFD